MNYFVIHSHGTYHARIIVVESKVIMYGEYDNS